MPALELAVAIKGNANGNHYLQRRQHRFLLAVPFKQSVESLPRNSQICRGLALDSPRLHDCSLCGLRRELATYPYCRSISHR